MLNGTSGGFVPFSIIILGDWIFFALIGQVALGTRKQPTTIPSEKEIGGVGDDG